MKKNRLLNILIIFFIVCIGITSLSFFFIESDYLWHIKVGEYIFHHGVLKKDVFSWFLNGKYWMSHEWLFEFFIYSLKNLFGNLHILIYCTLCVSLLLSILFIYNKRYIYINILFSIIWISWFLIIVFFMQARPHLISYSFLALTVYFLYDLYNNENSKKIYFLPILGILWANVHGGSSNLIYILCFMFTFVGLFNFSFSKIEAKRLSKKQLLKSLIVGIVCIFSIIINIHGIKMLVYPYQNILDSTMLDNISEWRSSSLSTPIHYVFYFFSFFVFMVFLLSKKKIRFLDFVLFLFVIYLGLKSIRFWFYSYIISSFFIFYYVQKRKVDKGTDVGLFILSIFMIVFSITKMNSIFIPNYSYVLNEKDINMIKKIKPKRLFNMYNFGGDLIYNDIKVFIDGRADLYSLYNFDDYLNISNLSKDYVSLINKYDFDYMLVSEEYPINTYLSYSEEYSLIYHRKHVKLYKKTN